MSTTFSRVEESFYRLAGEYPITTRLPYILVKDFPKLGLLTSLRFLEWALENPEGVISLPTGKTPEYFIASTRFLLDNWNKKKGEELRKPYGLESATVPDLRGLHFVQIDEFYPIDTAQRNSFYYYVNRFYISQFGLDSGKALLIDSSQMGIPPNYELEDIWPNGEVDLSLRYRHARDNQERIQKQVLQSIDQWCRYAF